MIWSRSWSGAADCSASVSAAWPNDDESAVGSRWKCLASRYEESPALQVASRLAVVGIGVRLRNRRTPGARLTGMRVIDAHTGGPMTARSHQPIGLDALAHSGFADHAGDRPAFPPVDKCSKSASLALASSRRDRRHRRRYAIVAERRSGAGYPLRGKRVPLAKLGRLRTGAATGRIRSRRIRWEGKRLSPGQRSPPGLSPGSRGRRRGR